MQKQQQQQTKTYLTWHINNNNKNILFEIVSKKY